MECMSPLGCLSLVLGASHQQVGDPDPLDHQHLVFEEDVTLPGCRQTAIAGVDPARLQRATQGAGQSTSRRGDDVVEGGGVVWELARRRPIVLAHLVVGAEQHRLGFGRHVCLPDRASLSDDADARDV